MPTSDQDARALTYLAKRLRDETHGANHWDEAGIWAHVSKLIGRNLAVTIEQVTRHAADPTAKTPGAIGRPFLPEPVARRTDLPPRRDDECRTHPGEWADTCRACASETKGGEAYGHDDTQPATGWTPDRIRQRQGWRGKEER